MTKRANHYERAFEHFLRAHQMPYVAVDEQKRALLGDGSLKSLDFIVSTPTGESWLVDVKGRRFPAGRQRRYWRNWSTEEDLESLAQWEDLFGQRFGGLFVFAYNVVGDVAPVAGELLFESRGLLYGFVAIRLADYASHARVISPRWKTVAMPTRRFRELAQPVQRFL